MELHVLGASGGALLDKKPSSFLLDGRLLLDAGTICSALSFEEVLQVEGVFLSHTHLDHVKDLGLMSDLLTGLKEKPVDVFGTPQVLKVLRENYFNNLIWPDFTQIPHPSAPVLRLRELQPLQTLHWNGFRILPIPVEHTVETCAFLVSWEGGSLLYSADTGPTDLLWTYANQQEDLRALILDVAFPSRMQWLADLSKHLTPTTAQQELAKLRWDIPIFFFHLKPGFYEETERELRSWMREGWQILKAKQRYLLTPEGVRLCTPLD